MAWQQEREEATRSDVVRELRVGGRVGGTGREGQRYRGSYDSVAPETSADRGLAGISRSFSTRGEGGIIYGRLIYYSSVGQQELSTACVVRIDRRRPVRKNLTAYSLSSA